MRSGIFLFLILLLWLSVCLPASSQEDSVKIVSAGYVIDSLKNIGYIFDESRKRSEIILSTDQAVRYLQQRYHPKYWNNSRDPFRLAMGQLVYEASQPPFDSTKNFLNRYPFDSLSISWDQFYIWEPLRFKVPVAGVPGNTFPSDSLGDSLSVARLSIIQPYNAPILPVILKDTTILVVLDTLREVSSSKPGFPFKYFNYPYQADSIQVAVSSLLRFLEKRDSSIINFTGLGNAVTPVWMNSGSDKVIRYWLKNEYSDSVTIWIGNPSRNTIGLYLENGVNFRRPVKQQNYSDARVNLKSLDNSKLLEIQEITVKPRYWKYRTEASFVLSQASLTNWVKGGENSISILTDIIGFADYTNNKLRISSSNYARMKLGFLKSGDNPVRKNLDLIETNSKLNHKAFGKFDFSAILLFKTQLAAGYSYTKDTTILVSKFMNPSILTIGLGLDYKPSKVTSINFSPFSYKSTFVSDTINIDKTKYGIQPGRRSLNEPGASLVVTNVYELHKNVSITNRLQLFTNYINNPLNIDVDWEMIVVARLNWFTDVRLNTHLIFDDDTKTVVLDDDKNPVMGSDGLPKKTARVQFKEMLGLSLVFRF